LAIRRATRRYALVSSEADKVNRALVAWTGWGDTPWPSRDESRVVELIGDAEAVGLLPTLLRLEDDFYSSGARLRAKDLTEMYDQSVAEFRERHPELTEDAAVALGWCYTFDYK
jgi:hypothetical protein